MGNATGFPTLLATTTTPSLFVHRLYTSLLRLTNHRLTRPRSSISHRRFHHHHSNRGRNFNLPLSSPHPLKLNASHSSLHTQAASIHFPDSSSSSSSYPAAHPWPEWSSFIKNLYNSGYYNYSTQGFGVGADEFVSVTSFPVEFIRAATACFAFAYEKPDFLGMLSRRDIEVLVENGTPFLFKNGEESLRRMRVFLSGNGCGDSNGVSADRAQTVDLMRFLVSYASAVVSSENNIRSDIELVESSVRNLLSELAWLSYVAPDANLSGSVQNQLPGAYGQPPRTFEQSIQMKKGEWVCPRCSFMNFARNMKCFECDEARPKRKLTGGEWECPRCNFFNYVRNIVCLRCDSKRPEGLPHERTGSGSGIQPGKISSAYVSELKSRPAANEEKAQRWFSKISQTDGTLDMSSAIADEDFPEILQLRKGVNRFVVSTRKTPLDRRLVNAQHQGNLGPGGILDNKSMQSTDNTEKQNVSWSVDDIIGHKSSVFELGNKTLGSGQDDGTNSSLLITNSAFTHSSTVKGSNSDFVPFPGKEPENSKMDETSKVGIENQVLSSSSGRETGAVSGGNDVQSRNSWQPSEKPLSHDKDTEQAEKSERWSTRVAELHNVTDVASSILDDDFPEIMPTHKGLNRFVVSKKKDRSLTSPAYKRRGAMEQSNNANFVPFVPFPPNYFARKDNQQPDGQDLANKTAGIMPNSPTLEKFSEKINDTRPRLQVTPDMKRALNREYPTGSRNSGHGIPMSANSTRYVIEHGPQSWNGCNHGYTLNENMSSRENMMSNSQQNFGNNQTGVGDSMKSGESWRENSNETSNSTGTTAQTSENLNIGDSWSGKSLDGSAVKKEPDPLDMSEEAKAERWFRRVARIKNISELSQIPDEDFPSIMPMWKGVNRFVVRKRKTPLERRLTSPQYRRNLPTMDFPSTEGK